MNRYVKEFLHRGLIFAGFGPLVLAIVYFAISKSLTDFSLDGKEILLGVFSVYFLAFLQAGATVFNQIESWNVPKSLFFHFLTLYIAYVGCYLLNSWIPFKVQIVAIFTAIFVVLYFVIWIAVFLSVKSISRKLNTKIN